MEGIAANIAEIFQETAARLIEEWSRNASPATPADQIVRAFLLESVQHRVRKLQDSLDTLATQLRSELKETAASLGVTDAPGEDEFQSLVRGTPIFDPGDIRVSVSPSAYAALFGRRYAENRVAGQVRRQLGEPFEQAFGNYVEVLKEWTRLVTAQISRRFETYAERYRAQAERSLGGKELTLDEAHLIEANLGLLGGPPRETGKRDFARESALAGREMIHQPHKGEPNEIT